MTGGGAGDLAWLHEPVDDYAGTPTDTTYKAAGQNQRLEDLTIDNALQRLRNMSIEAVEAIETTFEGAISVTGTVTEDTAWLLNHILGSPPTQTGAGPYSYEWSIATQRVQSARFYVGLDFLSGYAERELKGVVFPQIEFTNNIGESTTFTATGFFADEAKATTATPGSEPSTTSDAFVFHGGNLSIDATTQKKMQNGTLSIQTGAHPLRGWERKPTDATFGAAEHTLNPTKIVTGVDLLGLAYGNGTAPVTSSGVGSVPGILTLGNGSETLTFELTGVTSNTYSWDEIGNAESDKTESPELFVNSVTATLDTSTSAAQ